MILSRHTRTAVLMLMLVATLTPSAAAQPDAALYQAIDKACSDAETELTAALDNQKWTQPYMCKDENDFDETACRSAVEHQIHSVIKSTMQSQKQKIRKAFLTTLANQPADQVGPLYKTVDQVLSELSHEVPKVDVIEKGVQGLSAEELRNPDQYSKQISKKAVVGFGQGCRTRTVVRLAQVGRDDAGSAYLASLRKETGFSKIVRCVWQRDGRHHRLDCAPGLQVTGQDVAVIQILPPPEDGNFRLTWVQAIGAEELPGTSNRGNSQYLDKLHCPGYPGAGKKANLACDELCFGNAAQCDQDTYRPLAIQSAVVAVHTQRRFGTTYGCAVHRRDCAQQRLRPSDRTKTQPAKLTLLTRGRTPMIRVRAMDQRGNVAEGEVLVGYPRWRVESGGFMGIAWNAVDQQVVTTPVDATSGKVMVADIRDSDTYAQETGIFVNLIPSNYEWIGASLGFATADGKAPSVYLGPTIRLTTFGNRGLAALSAGVVMRQVDRFPDLTVGQELAGDSRLLEPDRQFEVDGYLGIQLGFSFGPISVSDSEY